jgi:hypothetical protein
VLRGDYLPVSSTTGQYRTAQDGPGAQNRPSTRWQQGGHGGKIKATPATTDASSRSDGSSLADLRGTIQTARAPRKDGPLIR